MALNLSASDIFRFEAQLYYYCPRLKHRTRSQKKYLRRKIRAQLNSELKVQLVILNQIDTQKLKERTFLRREYKEQLTKKLKCERLQMRRKLSKNAAHTYKKGNLRRSERIITPIDVAVNQKSSTFPLDGEDSAMHSRTVQLEKNPFCIKLLIPTNCDAISIELGRQVDKNMVNIPAAESPDATKLLDETSAAEDSVDTTKWNVEPSLVDSSTDVCEVVINGDAILKNTLTDNAKKEEHIDESSTVPNKANGVTSANKTIHCISNDAITISESISVDCVSKQQPNNCIAAEMMCPRCKQLLLKKASGDKKPRKPRTKKQPAESKSMGEPPKKRMRKARSKKIEKTDLVQFLEEFSNSLNLSAATASTCNNISYPQMVTSTTQNFEPIALKNSEYNGDWDTTTARLFTTFNGDVGGLPTPNNLRTLVPVSGRANQTDVIAGNQITQFVGAVENGVAFQIAVPQFSHVSKIPPSVPVNIHLQAFSQLSENSVFSNLDAPTLEFESLPDQAQANKELSLQLCTQSHQRDGAFHRNNDVQLRCQTPHNPLINTDARDDFVYIDSSLKVLELPSSNVITENHQSQSFRESSGDMNILFDTEAPVPYCDRTAGNSVMQNDQLAHANSGVALELFDSEGDMLDTANMNGIPLNAVLTSECCLIEANSVPPIKVHRDQTAEDVPSHSSSQRSTQQLKPSCSTVKLTPKSDVEILSVVPLPAFEDIAILTNKGFLNESLTVPDYPNRLTPQPEVLRKNETEWADGKQLISRLPYDHTAIAIIGKSTHHSKRSENTFTDEISTETHDMNDSFKNNPSIDNLRYQDNTKLVGKGVNNISLTNDYCNDESFYTNEKEIVVRTQVSEANDLVTQSLDWSDIKLNDIVLNIEKQMEDDVLSLTTTCFSSPNEYRAIDSPILQTEHNEAANDGLINAISTIHSPPTQQIFDINQYKIPKLTNKNADKFDVKTNQTSNNSPDPQSQSVQIVTATAKVESKPSSIEIPAIFDGLWPISTNVKDFNSSVDFFEIAKAFGVTCLAHLSGNCKLSLTCPYFHKYNSPTVVQRVLESLEESALNIAYSFMYNNKELFNRYFAVFSKIYALKNQSHKLFNMVRDCERYDHGVQFLPNIFNSIIVCGIGKVEACGGILRRVRSTKRFNTIDILLNIIIDADWTQFTQEIEAFAHVPRYYFRLNIFQHMASTVMQNKEYVSVFCKCLVALHPKDYEVVINHGNSDLKNILRLLNSAL